MQIAELRISLVKEHSADTPEHIAELERKFKMKKELLQKKTINIKRQRIQLGQNL